MAYDKTTFLSGLAMGLCGKGNPTFTGSDVFTKGYLAGAELRAKRVTTFALAAGLYETGTSNLIYSWKQLLGNEILDGGVVHVADGVVTTNPIESNAENASCDYLAGDLVLPNDGSVTELGADAFVSCRKMTSISIPATVNYIGDGAFCYWYSNELKLIVDNRSLTYYGKYSFLHSNVSAVYITDMGMWCKSTFYGYSPLTDVEYLYLNGKPVTDLVIPNGVEAIGNGPFANYQNLRSLAIPKTVTDIASNAFEGCPNIASVTVAEDNPAYCSVENTVYSKDMKTLCCRLVPFSGVFVVPDGVTTIGSRAFAWATDAMTGVQLPNSVTTIDFRAFYECGGLTSFVIPSSVTSIGSYAFAYCTKLTEVTFAGTVEQWNAIELNSAWRGAYSSVTITRVVCSDGIITL